MVLVAVYVAVRVLEPETYVLVPTAIFIRYEGEQGSVVLYSRGQVVVV
jgi:hypothetical protein